MPDVLGVIIGICSVIGIFTLFKYSDDLSDGNIGVDMLIGSYDSKFRQRVKSLSHTELLQIFDEMQFLETKMYSPEDSLIRKIATEELENSSTAMFLIGHEVWRELYIRAEK